MKSSFRISGLPLANFAPLFALNESDLAKKRARRLIVDAKPGFPCRVSLRDAEIGERVILLPFAHQPVDSPYCSSGPIFVREKAEKHFCLQTKFRKPSVAGCFRYALTTKMG